MTVIGKYDPPDFYAHLKGRQPSRKSQSGRILLVLADGQWHSTREILQRVPCIVHSRISELRKVWHLDIEHRTTGPGAGGSEYRLLSRGRDLRGSRPSESGPGSLHSPRPARPAQLHMLSEEAQ